MLLILESVFNTESSPKNSCKLSQNPNTVFLFFLTGKLPHKYKIVVAGNHDLGFEDGEELSEKQLAGLNMLGINRPYDLLTNCIYLCDRQVEVTMFVLHL